MIRPTRRIRIADVAVAFDAAPAETFDYLVDPANRPGWQASLRRVDRLAAIGESPGEAGTSWTDITWVPGVSPTMEVTDYEPPRRWREIGRWWWADASLTLTFRALADSRTEVRATAFLTVPTLLAPGAIGLAVVTPWALRADLRSAAAAVAE